MSGIPSSSTPTTPFPDAPSDIEEGLAAAPPPPTAPPLSTSSSDELGVLLSQPTPDPYLREVSSSGSSTSCEPVGAATEGRGSRPEPTGEGAAAGGFAPVIPTPTHAETGLPIRLSSEEHPRPILDGAIPERAEVMDEGAEPGPGRISWPLLLVSSYASALTLALVWILWSGRNIPRPSESSEPERAEPRASRPVQAGSTSSSPTLALAEDRLTTLGRPIRLGEIEVIPRAVARQPVVLERLQGTSDDRRESDPVLSLSLQIRNLSRAESFAPLDSALVREPAPGPDQPCLEVVGRRRIPLFSLAPESEWSIVGQDFPTLGPGESADTILVTEPFSMTALSDPLIWRVKLRTGPFQTDVVGVRFHTRDILEPQGNFERPGQSPTP